MREKIFIGIPCYAQVSPETLEDYMRFAFHLGRRYREYDFFLGVKTKSEQFRARNVLVESAISIGCDWMLMLDDDHVLDISGDNGNPAAGTESYNFLRKLLEHDVDIVGPVYYQRGGSARPVVMEMDDNGPYFISSLDLGSGLQERAVQGGGCMLIKMQVFNKIKSPWFEPEFDMGTDVQICTKAREAGFKVYNDPTLEIGHVLNERTVITGKNKNQFKTNFSNVHTPQETDWQVDGLLHKLKYDAAKYLGIRENEIDFELKKLWDNYEMASLDLETRYGLGTKEYYAHMGPEQIARQILFHHNDYQKSNMAGILQEIKPQKMIGMDFGCGSAPIGFELAKRGGFMHFVDVDGAGAYEFLKWRCKKYGLSNVSFEWPAPESLNYCLCMDSVEHLHDWKTNLYKIMELLKLGGNLVTNFMRVRDEHNPEHVMMDKPAFVAFMTENNFRIHTDCVFVKQ